MPASPLCRRPLPLLTALVVSLLFGALAASPASASDPFGALEPSAVNGPSTAPRMLDRLSALAAVVPECAATTLGTSFATAPISGSIVGTESDCIALDGVASGDRVDVTLATVGANNPGWVIIDGSGVERCAGIDASGACTLSGTEGWAIRVLNRFDDAGFTYTLAARRMTQPAGCTALDTPTAWSFGAPALTADVPGTAQAKCYTFTRAAGEADGVFWFRVSRTSGAFLPSWRVYGPTGVQECAGTYGDYDPCALQAAGTFTVVVDDQGRQGRTGSFALATKRVTAPEGCAAVSSTSFDVAATSGAIAAAGEIDCFTLPGLASGDQVEVRSASNATRWAIVDGAGHVVCGTSGTLICALTGTPDWSLLTYDYAGDQTFAYSFTTRRINDPQGCSPLGEPAAWSFTAPRINGSIPSGLGARCYTFSRGVDEADAAYWFRTLRTSGTLSPRWRVFGPTGTQECSGTSSGFTTCTLVASGAFTIVVDDNYGSGEASGSFSFAASRVSAPTGCSALPDVSVDGATTTSALSATLEVDCYTLPNVADSDQIAVRLAGGTPYWAVVDAAGHHVCSYGSDNECLLSGTGGWSLLVYDYGGAATASYSLAVRRLTTPQGCVPLDEPTVWSFDAARMNGTIAGPLGARCYTFTRTADEPDGGYWFRTARTSGTLNPGWRVYGPTGTRECSGPPGGSYTRCQLYAPGNYMVLVEDQYIGLGTGAFSLVPRRLTPPSGCATLSSSGIDAPPVSTTIGAIGEVDCHTLAGVAVGDRIEVKFGAGSASWVVVDATGTPICQGSSTASCTLTGSSGWSVLTYDNGGDQTFSYAMVVRRLSDLQGCVPIDDPAAWSFTAPRITGTIDGTLGARCYRFTRGVADPDGAYWIRTLRTAGTLSPRWRVLGPGGQEECAGYASSSYSRCQLLAGGTYNILVEDDGGSQTGSYALTPRRVNDATGCADAPAVAFGAENIIGTLGSAAETDCYNLPAASGDVLTFSHTGAGDQLAVVDANGELRCQSWSSTCTMAGDPPYRMLITASAGSQTGGYRFAIACTNVPCGQSDTAVTDVVPARAGASAYTTVLLRGRDLDLLQSVKLTRGDRTVTGTVQPLANDADGRGREVRFDLEAAPVGKWDMEATFLDGTVRTNVGALTVEAERPANISVQLVGRDVFRSGQPTTVTVDVTNSGNVDGIAVPVVLRGIPTGSTIEPVFQLHVPSGSGAGLTYNPLPFRQEDEVLSTDKGLVLPVLLGRVPAGRSVRLEYRITVPATVNYELRAQAGKCLGTTTPGVVTPGGGAGLTRLLPDEASCLGSIGGLAANLLPGGGCVKAVAGIAMDGATAAAGGDSFLSWSNFFGWMGGALDCASEFFPPTAIARRALDVVEVATIWSDTSQVVGDCMLMPDGSVLPQRAVTSIDPNDIRGPVGSGAQRYIPGDGPLNYEVLFENLPAATAPAQRVTVTDQLDPAKVDPASVLFQSVRFGSTTYTLPYPDHSIDQKIDLRPQQNLVVHVTAGVTGGGQVHWELQAIDPETLAPPEDPLAGFLPPNANSPEGEGTLAFSVNPRALPSGAVITNQASIRFDTNEPIETPTWSNTIDRQAPVPSVAAEAAADPRTAKVTWSGTDDAAGITFWEIRVSKDGGPSTLWRTAETANTASYVATTPGQYSFRVVAHDGAGNVAQSAQSAVTLGGADTTAPDTTIAAGPSGVIDDATPTFTFSASEAGATFTCSVDGAAWTACASPFTTAALADGDHSFAVRAMDDADNTDATPASRAFTVRTTVQPPPTGGGNGGGNGPPVAPPDQTVGGASEDGATVAVAAPRIAAAGKLDRLIPSKTGAFALPLKAVCPPGAGGSCRATVTVKVGKATLGTLTVTVKSGATSKLGGKLSAAGLKTLKRKGSLTATITIRVTRGAQSATRTNKATFAKGKTKGTVKGKRR